ncbi:MAG: hypothetical protein JXQ30_11640 [Spirochaetes bacterium]|nr:hypothetical protein [Spirochaetota bacterium]
MKRASGTATARLLLVAAFLLLVPTALLAQDGDGGSQDSGDVIPAEENIFDENAIFDEASFEKAVEESKKEEAGSKLETLVGADFVFSNSWLQPLDFDTYSLSSQFYGKVFAKAAYPEIASIFVSYNYSIPLFYYSGNIEPYTGYPPSSVYAELSELFLSFDVYKKVFFRLGYQLVAWGPSFFWTPVDFINRDKLDPLAQLDLRTGKPGAKITVPFEGSNLVLFFDFSQSIDEASTTASIEDRTRVGARFDTVILGYELGLSTYLGNGLTTLWGLDFSGVLFRSDFYGEVAVSKGSNTQKARAAAVPSTYELYYPQEIVVATSLGLAKSFGEFKRWTVRGEAYFNSNGYGADAPYSYLLTQNLFSPLYMGMLYGYLSVTKDELFTQEITGTFALLMNVLDPSFDLSATMAFDIPNLIPFNVRLSFTGGEENREFTFFGGQAVTLSVYTKVSI